MSENVKVTRDENVKVTRDEILAGRQATVDAYCISTDSGASFEVVSVCQDGPVMHTGYAPSRIGPAITGYAISVRTGLVVRFVQTGKVERRSMLRVRVELPTDTGDRAGTLCFGDEKVGGWVNSGLVGFARLAAVGLR